MIDAPADRQEYASILDEIALAQATPDAGRLVDAPRALGVGEDARRLGIALVEMRLERESR